MTDQNPEVVVHGPGQLSRGAQVRLTGEAQTAARGGLAGDIEGNTLAKRAMEADGTVADGTTPDGSTLTGKPAADVVVEAEGDVPAEEGTTRVTVEEPTPEKAEAEAKVVAAPAPKPAAQPKSRG